MTYWLKGHDPVKRRERLERQRCGRCVSSSNLDYDTKLLSNHNSLHDRPRSLLMLPTIKEPLWRPTSCTAVDVNKRKPRSQTDNNSVVLDVPLATSDLQSDLSTSRKPSIVVSNV